MLHVWQKTLADNAYPRAIFQIVQLGGDGLVVQLVCSPMVCQDCEQKLSKVIVPDKWKDGARNTTGGDDGGRATSYRNSLLQVRGRDQRFQAGVRTCRICKTKVAQDAHYCQDCAFHNGICAMCGKRVDDLRFDRRGLTSANKRKTQTIAEDHRVEGGDYGTSERFKQARTETPAVPRVRIQEDHRAIEVGLALETAEQALAHAAGRTLVEHPPAPVPAPATDVYAGWASAKDVASGRVYYYNAKTKETSWVWPPAGFAKQDTQADFIPAATFNGKLEGYVLTTRQHGTGYYRDVDASIPHRARPFISATTFVGSREGYVFTTRSPEGTGYFLENGVTAC